MLIDSHCHLPDQRYLKSTDQLIKDAEAAGIRKFINIGTSLENNLLSLEVSKKYDCVYSAIGIYPHEHQDKVAAELEEALSEQLNLSNKIVAIGECGIDTGGQNWERTLPDQIDIFEMQLQLAVKNKLPIIIHNRGGDEIIFDILDKYISRGIIGVAHCFASTWNVAQKYLDRGFYLSFSGMITYKSRNELREVVKNVPQDRFIIETDSPLLPPEGFRGNPNEPAHVVEVAKKAAEIRSIEFDKVAELTYSNTCKLFNL